MTLVEVAADLERAGGRGAFTAVAFVDAVRARADPLELHGDAPSLARSIGVYCSPRAAREALRRLEELAPEHFTAGSRHAPASIRRS